jgi:hypothetical protein
MTHASYHSENRLIVFSVVENLNKHVFSVIESLQAPIREIASKNGCHALEIDGTIITHKIGLPCRKKIVSYGEQARQPVSSGSWLGDEKKAFVRRKAGKMMEMK